MICESFILFVNVAKHDTLLIYILLGNKDYVNYSLWFVKYSSIYENAKRQIPLHVMQ